MIEVKHYRKKPVVIQAVQLTYSNAKQVAEWSVGRYCENGSVMIMTLEGDHRARPGDYVIKGVAGEFYPCKPDIFEQTYEDA